MDAHLDPLTCGVPVATHCRVPPPHAGRCRDLATHRRGRFWAVTSTAAVRVALVGAAMLGLWVLEKFGFALAGLHFSERAKDVLFAAVGLCGTAALALVVVTRESPHTNAWTRHYVREMLAQIGRRGDDRFDARRADAIYAEVYPRRVWPEFDRHADAVEPGFLLLDIARRRLLFEGDVGRWVIPFESVRGYETPTQTTPPLRGYSLVVLTFETATGVEELPLLPYTGVAGVLRDGRVEALRILLADAIALPPLNPPAPPVSWGG